MNVLEFLHTRQSNPHLQGNAPDEDVINSILKAGMRVPDHAGLTPWCFTVVKDEGLSKLSKAFKSAITSDNGDEAKIEEQLIAAGCAAHAVQMAATSLGFGAMWRTGEMSYHPLVKERLGIELHEEIVGFVYIGDKSKELPLKNSRNLDDYVHYF